LISISGKKKIEIMNTAISNVLIKETIEEIHLEDDPRAPLPVPRSRRGLSFVISLLLPHWKDLPNCNNH